MALAVVAAYDGIGVNVLGDGDLAGARRKLVQILAALLAVDGGLEGCEKSAHCICLCIGYQIVADT